MKKITLFTLISFCCLAIGYAQPGELDPSFGTNGIMKTDYVTASIAIQNDGKIVVAGGVDNGDNNDLVIARYNADGSLDNTFSNDGKLIADFGSTDDYATSIAIQSDGKIVVAGSAIFRYNSDGTPDNTFDIDGKQTTDFRIITLAIQKDGKIIAAGDAMVARYNTDGSLDKIIPAFAFIASVAIQNDGKILAGGTSDGDFIIARYNTDGSLDSSFSGDGIQTTNFDQPFEYGTLPGADQGNTVIIQGDRK